MSGFFQRLKSRGRPTVESGEPRLTLAAFGKHPGWDDHMPSIGVETEALAYVQQTLYVGGIGKQVDSGAWEKLEPEKRLEGFDHIFLWQRANHILLGQLWSSRDRKGRAKYPMVLCVDGQGVSVELVLEKAWTELERLCEICRTATTAEQVIAECHAAQDRLREPGAPADLKPGMSASVVARRRFLEHPELGPERLGLLRVLHELRIAPANDNVKRSSQTNENAVRSCHLRVPAAANSSTESLALWAPFFQCAAPKGAPVLLISRKTTNWLDVVVGEPATDDFFCLGVSLKALPLTTEIPYELSPELKPSLEKVTSRFLGEEPTTAVVEQRAAATVPVASGKKIAKVPPSQKKRNLILPLVFCAVVLIGAGGLWLVSANRSAKPVSFESNSSAPVPSGATPVKVKETATTDESYNAAMKDARAALDRKDYASAMSQADIALGIRTNDPAAAKLKADAKAQLDLAAIAADQQRQAYGAAMKSGQAAFDRQDFSAAITQADVAMGIKTNDAAAAKLKADAQARLDLAALEIQRQEQYDAAMSEARAAFGKKDYSNTIAKADAALNLRTNDTTATKLRNEAQAAQREILAQAERDARYRELMNSAQAAYDGKDYPNAIERAEAALGIRPGDPAATGLQKKASDDKDLQNAQTCVARGEFQKAKILCSAHAGTPAFAELARKVKDKEAGRFDIELEVYLVRFGLLDPKKAKMNEARQETQWLGELPIQQRDQCLTDVEVLRKAFQSSDRLDAVHEKQLNELKKAINNHL